MIIFINSGNIIKMLIQGGYHGIGVMRFYKLDYDHRIMQRNQIYGNLWYQVDRGARGTELGDIDLHLSRTKELSLRRALKNKLGILKRKFR